MNLVPRFSTAAACALLLALSACTTTPPEDDEPTLQSGPGSAPVVTSMAPMFEERQRERARELATQGRWADAALAWEILTVLRPESESYRSELHALKLRIDAAASERMQRASQARQRGDLDTAAAYYLAALALQPSRTQAADALRAIERERNKRRYLGKPSRLTLLGRPPSEATVAKPATTTAGSTTLEHASMLATQGEHDDAIALLEKSPATGADADAMRAMLADLYFQKAEKLPAGEKAAAIAALEKALRLNPSHARAAAKLKQLKPPPAAGTPPASAPPAPRNPR